MKRLIKTLLITFLIIFSNCTQLEKAKETAIIKDVVMSYNRKLIDAAKTGDLELLRDIASEDVVRRLYFWIAAWSDSGVYMEAELKDIKYKSVDISRQTAKVLTLEKWVYDYRSIKNNQIVLPPSHLLYEMEYVLQKNKDNKNNNWIITEINIKSETQEGQR
ncbi:MAG: hypothetical protein HZA08_08810 [Nitrospirae bacterium]|nr:hypothetical protein [Nitrospirota bacterium]MBI5193524.1 hypothetical protein [Nitrospirota bacterium]